MKDLIKDLINGLLFKVTLIQYKKRIWKLIYMKGIISSQNKISKSVFSGLLNKHRTSKHCLKMLLKISPALTFFLL